MTRRWIQDLDELAGLDMRSSRVSGVDAERDATHPRSLKRLSAALRRLAGRHADESESPPATQDAHGRGSTSHHH